MKKLKNKIILIDSYQSCLTYVFSKLILKDSTTKSNLDLNN